MQTLDDTRRVDMRCAQAPATGTHAATTYEASHLFVDDCRDGYFRCDNDLVQTAWLGDIAVHRCWVWSELCCYPCFSGNDFGKMRDDCHQVYGAACDAEGCGAANLGSCGG